MLDWACGLLFCRSNVLGGWGPLTERVVVRDLQQFLVGCLAQFEDVLHGREATEDVLAMGVHDPSLGIGSVHVHGVEKLHAVLKVDYSIMLAIPTQIERKIKIYTHCLGRICQDAAAR